MKYRLSTALMVAFSLTVLAMGEQLTFSINDPVEDAWGCPEFPFPCTIPFDEIVEPTTDLVSMEFWFDNVTGEYSIQIRATPSHPFFGHFVLNAGVFNADTGQLDPWDAFFVDDLNYFVLAEPTTEMTLTGNSPILVGWKSGDRVSTCEGPGGVTPDACDEGLGFIVDFASSIYGFRDEFSVADQTFIDNFSSGPPSVIVSPESCATDSDCEDGLFCTWNSCDVGTGICGVITTCPAVIIDCVEYGSCDEENDECLAIPLCESEEVCAPDNSCVSPGQDVGSEVCRQVQQEAQQTVLAGSPFKNHGQMVRTAARVVSQWVEAGVITDDCGGAIMNQFGRGIPTEEQEPTGPDAGCFFTMAGTLVARPGSDYDTLGFTGSTFLLEIQTDPGTVPTVETLYSGGIPFTVSEFYLTSDSALHWSPSGSSSDGDYSAPVRLTFMDDMPDWMPGIPDPVGVSDEIELNAVVEIGGADYELRMLFYYASSEIFEEDELEDVCIFGGASLADITVQQLHILPYSSDAAFDLQVEDIVFTSSP